MMHCGIYHAPFAKSSVLWKYTGSITADNSIEVFGDSLNGDGCIQCFLCSLTSQTPDLVALVAPTMNTIQTVGIYNEQCI